MDETNKKKGNISSIKNWKSVKESINGSASVVKYAFESPRQQQDQNNDPEVMQFKASQRLSNVNQPLPAVFGPPSVATNAVSQQPPPATVNPAPSSSNSQPRPLQSDILQSIKTSKMQESSSSKHGSSKEEVNSVEQLNEIHFSRSKLAKICHSPIFDKTVLGCFVRISVGKVNRIRVYRAAQVIEVVEITKEYKVDKVYTKTAFRLKHGSDERIWRLEHLNNGEITNNEYFEWRNAMKTAKLPLPTTEFIQQKRKDIVAALNYNFTEGAKKVHSDTLGNIEATNWQESSISSNHDSLEKEVDRVEQLNEIRFSRSQLAKLCHLPIFEKTVLGCFVRISVGNNIYRAVQVIGVVECTKEYKVNEEVTKKAFRVKHGPDERIWLLNNVYDSKITNNEYFEWRDAMKKAKLPLPTTEFIQLKRNDIVATFNYNFTENGTKKVQSVTLSDTEATKMQRISRSPSNLLERSITNSKYLNQIGLKRFKLAKFCHLPTFDKTVLGCFVRIRDRDENDIDFYRAAQIIEVVESAEEYNFDRKRTNKEFRVQHGPDEWVRRLEFISNNNITRAEYREWRNAMRKARWPIPSLEFIEQKRIDIKEAFNYNILKKGVKKETASSFTQTICDPEIERIMKENETLKVALQKRDEDKERDQKIITELKEKVAELERDNLNLKSKNHELHNAKSAASAFNFVENIDVIRPVVTIKQEPITLDDDYHTAAKRRRISFHESAVDNEMQLRFGRFQKESITLSVPLNEHNAVDVKHELGPTCADIQAALPNQPNLVKAPTQCVYEYWKPLAEGSNHDFEEGVAEILQRFRYNLFHGEGEKRPLHLVIKDSLLFPTNFTQKYKQCLEIDAKYPQAVESITDVIEDEIEQQKNDYVVKNIIVSLGFDLATREPEITDAIRVLKSFLKKFIVVIREAFDPNGPKRYKNGNKENAPFIAEIPKLIILTIPFIPSHPTAATYNHQISHMNETIKNFVEERKEKLFKDYGQIIEIYDWQKESQNYDKVNFKNWESRYKVLTTALCEKYQMFTVENVE